MPRRMPKRASRVEFFSEMGGEEAHQAIYILGIPLPCMQVMGAHAA